MDLEHGLVLRSRDRPGRGDHPVDEESGFDDAVLGVERRAELGAHDALAVLIGDEHLVVAREKARRRARPRRRPRCRGQVVQRATGLVLEGAELGRERLERRAKPRRHLPCELRDVGQADRTECSDAAADEPFECERFRWPAVAADPVAGGDIRGLGSAVLPVPSRWCRHEVGVRADVAPEQPCEPFVEDIPHALPQVCDDGLLRLRRPRERDRERGHSLGVGAARDLYPIPRAALEILSGDRVRVEISRAHQVQGAAHEPSSNDRVPFERRPEPLPPELEQKSFHLPPGFEIQLVASEPDLRKPMNMAFDAAGRLWITESREYPIFAKPGQPMRDTIRIFSDFDANGHARERGQLVRR